MLRRKPKGAQRLEGAARLAAIDERRGYSAKAQGYAQKLGHGTTGVSEDFGRNLKYYSQIHRLLERHCRGIREKKILHIGSSAGIYVKFLQDRGAKAIALDVSEDASRIAKAIGNRNVVRGDAAAIRGKRQLPFKDNSIDVFVSDHFLFSSYERIEGTGSSSLRILEDLHRVLKPGGIGIIHFYSHNVLPDYLGEIGKLGFGVEETLESNYGTIVLRKKR